MPRFSSHLREPSLGNTGGMMSHNPRQHLQTAVCITFYLLLLPGGTLGQTISPEPGGTLGQTVLPEPDPVSCPAADNCNTAAAVIGSLVAGCVLGAVLTCCVQYLLRRRKQQIPPKDYAVTEGRRYDVTEGRRYDVNRNSDGSIHVTSAQSREHKKLERLVKLSHTSPGDPETAPAGEPLIHNLSSTDPGPTTNNPSTPSHTSLPAAAQDVTYANIGPAGSLAHPYDTLDIIPEESEYETVRSSISEGILVPADVK